MRMIKYYVLASFTTFFLFSCSKKDDEIIDQPDQDKTILLKHIYEGSTITNFEYYNDNKLKSVATWHSGGSGNKWEYSYSSDTTFRHFSYVNSGSVDTNFWDSKFVKLSESSYNYYNSTSPITFVETSGINPCGYSQVTQYRNDTIYWNTIYDYIDANCSFTRNNIVPNEGISTYIKDDKNSWEQFLNYGYRDYTGGNTIEHSYVDLFGNVADFETYEYEFNSNDFPISMITNIDGIEFLTTFEYY